MTTSLYDLLGSNQSAPPAHYDVYDAPDTGFQAVPTRATQAGMERTQPSMAAQLMSFLRSQKTPDWGGKPSGGQSIPALPSYLPPDQPKQASTQGFLVNSQHGVDLGTIVKLAAIAASMGAAAPAVAGAAGAGAGAAGAGAGAAGAAGAEAAGGGGAMGMLGGLGGGGGGGGAMGMLGGIFGGGGEKKSALPPMLMPAPQVNTSRLYG
jgi:hypothetical protein